MYAYKEKANKHQSGHWVRGVAIRINAMWRSMREAIQKVLVSYRVFFNLIWRSGQTHKLLLVLLLIAVQQIVVFKVQTLSGLWDIALTNKAADAFNVGMGFLQVVILTKILNELAEYIMQYIIVECARFLGSQVFDSIDDKERLVYFQENEYKSKRAIVDVLFRDVDGFLKNFMFIHIYLVAVFFWLITAINGLNTAGVLLQGSYAIAAIVIWVVLNTKYLNAQSPRDRARQSENACQFMINRMVHLEYLRFFPNIQSSFSKYLQVCTRDYAIYSCWANLYSSVVRVVDSLIMQHLSLVVSLFFFLERYLQSSMKYSVLESAIFSMSQLGMVLGSLCCVVPHIMTLHTLGQYIEKAFDDYVNEKQRHARVVSTFQGLQATGSCELVQKSGSSVIKFSAELTGAVEKPLRRNYHEIEIQLGKVNLVSGKNGAGKSLFFKALSGMIPGVKISDNIKEKQCFAIYSLQEGPIWISRDSDEDPWTPMQLMTLWWPQANTEINIEDIDEDNGFLCYEDERVQYTDLINKVDEILTKLGFSYENSGKEPIRTVKQIKDEKLDISRFSGGQKKKIVLAMYLAMVEAIKPCVFLLDEPFNDLDGQSKAELMQIILDMKQSKTAVFVVTHGDESKKYYDNVLELDCDPENQSNIKFFGPQENYGAGALSSLTRL